MKDKYIPSKKKLPQKFLQHAIIKLMRRKPSKAFSLGNVVNKLQSKNSKDSIQAALDVLEAKKNVSRDKQGQYRLSERSQRISSSRNRIVQHGRTDLTSSGAAYIIVEGQESDIYIPPKHVNGALQGDTVKIEVDLSQGRSRPKGKVLEVLKRHRTRFIGTFQEVKKYGYVFVETQKLSIEIRILPDDFNEAESGDNVVVDVTDFGSNRHQQLLGKIKTVLNPSNRNDFEMRSILINNGFDTEFAEEVIQESEQLSDEITTADIEARRDMREVLTFTIDPADAKDFDDAISYQKLDNGNIQIGIHIADVTHFVRPATALDKEAYHRSTSVYLVDRVCPMLPERISNELCSLRPNEDKFCFSVILDFNEKHEVVKQWIGKTLIHSDHRFAYEEAQESLDGEKDILFDELKTINAIAKTLNKKRFEEGSINFETDEIRFVLGENAKPIGIYRKTRKDAHKLIEEYMLLANKIVSKFVATKSKSPEVPFVYRVHDLPDNDRLIELALLASEFGIKLNFNSPKHITESLNSLSKSGSQEDVLAVLKPMAIRSMSKAVYASDNIGHYGLGFEYYSHFTSPIRRYADVLVHRILEANLRAMHRVDKEILEGQCLYISQKERDATSAERESIKYKQVEYLGEKIGETFEGMIRNIIDRGMFVELVESQADGFIPLDSLGENVLIHPAKIKVTGQSSGRVWRIGDRITIQLAAINMDKRQLDFVLPVLSESDD